MTELNLFTKFRSMCIAHTHSTEWLECHGFGVGYLWSMNLDNFDSEQFQKDYFYSQAWFDLGKDSEKMKLDFPFCLMLPPRTSFRVNRSTQRDALKDHFDATVTLYIFDLLHNDRNNNPASVYALRQKEQVWNDCAIIGRQLMVELAKVETDKKYLIKNDGEFNEERVYDTNSARLIGVQFDFVVQMFAHCEIGTFDYTKVQENEVSNLKCD